MKTLLLTLLLVPMMSFGQDNNYSMSLDGVDDYIDFGNSTDFDFSNTSFSIGCWVDINVLNGFPGIIDKSEINNNGWFLTIECSPTDPYYESYRFSGAINSSNYFNAYSNSTFEVEKWHHIFVIFENGNQKFYWDGVLATTDNWTNNVLNTPTNLQVGYKTGGMYYDGNIDDVQIWDIALTETDVVNYMNCPPNGNEIGLVGYWNFEEGSGTNALDLTSNGNNGVIIGAIYDTDTPPQNCNANISELNNTPKQLMKIVDVLGRETPFKPNTPLLYIYNNGTVERKVVLK